MPDQEVENKDLTTIKNWLVKQPHLPHEVGEYSNDTNYWI